MKIVIRKVLSSIFRSTEFVLKTLVIVIIQKLTFRSNASLRLSFDSTLSVDGTGAQLQRLISVYALANYFGLGYLHSDIKQVSVHPLDPFQTEELYQNYLNELNEFIVFTEVSSQNEISNDSIKYEIRFWKFMFLLLRNRFRGKKRTLAILEPYSVTEFRPDILSTARDKISIKKEFSTEVERPYVVIHYRQGVGGFAIYPGQNIARETPLKQFESVLNSIFKEIVPKYLEKIIVLTDAPAEVTHYCPPFNQHELWEGTPGYEEGVMKIQPIDFVEFGGKFGIPVEVIRGGNPLEAIEIMAQSEFLVMSKSSLSYLGGFLNRVGEVYYPKDFWHRPLPGWKGF